MLNLNQKTYIYTLLILLVCAACTEKKVVTHLTSDFFLRYSYDSGDFKSEARFRDAYGKLNELPTAPTINGNPMRHVDSPGKMYLLSKSEKLISNFKIAWQDISGDTTSISIEISPITDFYFSEKKINLSKEQTLLWKGKPLQKNESLVFLWEKDGEAISMQITKPTDQSSLTLPLAQLRKLNPGNWSLYLVRKQRKTIQTPPFKSTTVFEFYTNSKSFEVY